MLGGNLFYVLYLNSCQPDKGVWKANFFTLLNYWSHAKPFQSNNLIVLAFLKLVRKTFSIQTIKTVVSELNNLNFQTKL